MIKLLILLPNCAPLHSLTETAHEQNRHANARTITKEFLLVPSQNIPV